MAPTPKTPAERFAAKVDQRHDDDCWPWLASLDRNGYGQFFDGATMVKAHRFALLLAGVDLISGAHVDHLCRNRWCVNPRHLEQVAPVENRARGAGRGQALWVPPATCRRGHERTEQNIRHGAHGPECRLCYNEAARRRYARKDAR